MVSWVFVLALLALWQAVPSDRASGLHIAESGGMTPTRMLPDEGLRAAVHAVIKRAEDRFAGGAGDLILTLGYVPLGMDVARAPAALSQGALLPNPMAMARPLARAPPQAQA